MKKVIIVDDEAPARELIREYLNGYPELVIVGECNNGVDALRTIETFSPDLVFLDVQMPGMTGFEVLEKLQRVPDIIFSTAYDQYALDAFEVNAIDYLLKPYTRERFGRAVQKVLTRPDSNLYLDQIRQLAERLESKRAQFYTGKLFVQTGKHLQAIDASEIIWLKAEKDYTWLVTASKRHLSSYGLGQLENKLDKGQFLRVHRSSIINLNYIDRIEKHISGYDILLTNGDAVHVSRSYMDQVRQRLL